MLNRRRVHSRQDHEQLVAFYRVITLQYALVVRIRPTAFLERNVSAARATIPVTIVFGEFNAPTIGTCLLLLRAAVLLSSRERNIDLHEFTGFDNYIFESVAFDECEVAIRLVLVELCDVWFFDTETISTRRQLERVPTFRRSSEPSRTTRYLIRCDHGYASRCRS